MPSSLLQRLGFSPPRLRLGLKFKLWLGIGLTLALGFGLLQIGHFYSIRASALDALRLESRTLGYLLKTTDEVFHQALIESGIPLGATLDLLPVHALARLAEGWRLQGLADVEIRVVSTDSPSPNNRPDAVERASMEHFRREPDLQERLVRAHHLGEARFYYAQPILTSADCLLCHGTAEQVPAVLRERLALPLGYREGELRAILSIRIPTAPIDQRVRGLFIQSMLGHLAVFIALFIVTGLLLQRLIIDRIGTLHQATSRLAQGHYDARVEDCFVARGADKLTGLALAFNAMAEQIALRQRQLVESEERLRLFIKHAPAALAMFDRNMRYLAASRRWLSDYGLGDTPILGRSHYEVFPEIPERWKAIHQRALNGDIVKSVHEAFARLDGSQQWLRWEIYPWHRFDGCIGGIVIFTEDITSQKAAEDAMEEANHYHRGLLEASLDALVVIDREGRISDVNNATEQLTGYRRTELLGTEFAAYFTRPEEARAAYRRAFEQGQVRDCALDLRHREGGRTPVLYNASVYRNAEGTVVAVFAAARDVTQQQRFTRILEARLRLLEHLDDWSLEQMLRASIDEASALTDSLIGFYHFLGEDQQTLSFQTWSSRTLDGVCQVRTELLHYPLSEAGVWADCVRERHPIIHNDYAALPNRRDLPEGHAELIRELVVPVMRKERIVAILGVGNKARDYDESDLQIVTTFADLAWDLVERKRDAEALRASEARYRRIVETTSEGVWILDSEARTSFVNARMASLLGCKPDAMLGRSVEDFLFPEDIPAYHERLAARRNGRAEHYERRLRRVDGSEQWVMVSATPIWDDQGQFSGGLAMLSDISLLKAQQQRLERMAHFDPLTGLPNRVLLTDRLHLAVASAQRHKRLLAICYLDLDGFKPVNDHLGHAAGDRLLIEIARRLREALRGEDTAARLGGDEFVLLLGDLTTPEQCQGTLERLLRIIAAPHEVTSGQPPVQVSASIGVTLYPLDQVDEDSLLRHADQAMYRAKQAGRSRICRYADDADLDAAPASG